MNSGPLDLFPSATPSAAALLRRDNPDVAGALIVDGQGTVRASDASTAELVAAAVALVAPTRELLDRLAAELGCGAIRSVFIEGDRASLAFADVDGSTTSIVIGQSGAAPGALRADAISLAASWSRGEGRAS